MRDLKHSKRKIFFREIFRVLKEKEEKQYREYRTHRLVLEACDKLEKYKGDPKKDFLLGYHLNLLTHSTTHLLLSVTWGPI